MNLSKPKFTGKYDLMKLQKATTEGEEFNKNEEKEKEIKLIEQTQ